MTKPKEELPDPSKSVGTQTTRTFPIATGMAREMNPHTPVSVGSAEARAAAAFRGWLMDGLYTHGIGNVQALARQLDVPVNTALQLWGAGQPMAELGMRTACALQGYIAHYGWCLIVEAGKAGASAQLERPCLEEVVDQLVAEWQEEPGPGFLQDLTAASLKRLLTLAMTGALAGVRLGLLCDTVPDDGAEACRREA